MYGQSLLRADWRLGCLGLKRGLHDRFGFGGKRIVVGQRKSPFSILGLQENAPLEEVKSAYKNMALKYHPDRLQNVPKYEEQRAKEKFHEIQEAYENIMDRHKLPKMSEPSSTSRKRPNAHTDKMYKKYKDHTDHEDFKDYATYKQDTNKSNYEGKTAGAMPTTSDAQMYTIIFTSMCLFYNIHLFTTIKKFSDPGRDLTMGETFDAMRLHFGGDSKYSWAQINKNRSTNIITSQLGKEEKSSKVEPKEPKNVEFLGQKLDPIEKSIGESSRGEEGAPRYINGNKPVRYHKHHHNMQVLYMPDYRTGQLRNDKEIRELYENTDPVLPVEVVIPMIKDPETGEWRKKTMHERYNKNRQVDRSQEQYVRKKSEKEPKKVPKQLSEMSLEELEKEAKKTRTKTERSLIE